MADATSDGFTRRAAIAMGLLALAVVLLVLLWQASEVLLLVFAAILVAVFLRGLSDPLVEKAGWSQRWAMATVILALLLVLALGLWLLTPKVAAQVDDLSRNLGTSLAQFKTQLQRYEWGQRLIENAPGVLDLTRRPPLLAQITGVFSTTLSLLTNTILVAFIGLYLALAPETYLRGVLHLLPPARRPRFKAVLLELGGTLRHWLIGRVILMVSNGALTALGLWALDVPLPIPLGILAGLFNFIPNIGPIIAGIPAVLIAASQSPQKGLWVLILYVVLQSADGYIFTPLVQQRTVSLPPALTIVAQLLFGVLAGGFGLLLATPLVAAGLVLVKRLYVEDILGDPIDAPPPPPG